MRNTVFLSLALAWAEVLGSFDIYMGINAIDYSGYPDCRPEFVAAFEQLANLATKAGVEKKGRFRIHTPLIQLAKADIIRLGASLGVDYVTDAQLLRSRPRRRRLRPLRFLPAAPRRLRGGGYRRSDTLRCPLRLSPSVTICWCAINLRG